MTTPTPKVPWYQFSLRSLLLLTVFVAVLCSIGVCTEWLYSVVIAIGAILGRSISRKRSGLALGVMAACMCSAIAAATCVFFWMLLFGMPLLWVPTRQFIVAVEVAAIIGSFIGGILGGIGERTRSER